MKKFLFFTTFFLASFSCKSSDAPKSKLDEDLKSLRIDNMPILSNLNGANALVEALNPFAGLHNVSSVITFVACKNPYSINCLASCGSTPLMLAVHGTFHLPLQHIKTLFTCKADIALESNTNALCELYKSANFLPDIQTKINAQKVANFLIQHGLRCAETEHWDTFKKYTAVAKATPNQKATEHEEKQQISQNSRITPAAKLSVKKLAATHKNNKFV